MGYVVEKRRGVNGVVNGKDVVIFSTNDYLALSAHPDVEKAALEALRNFGAGTGGAPGTTGTTSIHVRLSEKIAAFKSREKAVLFPSGYQANIAIHHALGADGSAFFLDKRHHPSAVDGARLPKGSRIIRFDHHELDGLEAALKSESARKRIVSLPSVFTVNGDIAPLDKIIDLKDRYGFVLVIDEAHATGCLGDTGRGLEEHFGLKGSADFIMGTFSKALGSAGGFLAFDRDHEELIKSGFRQFDYSTSLSAVCAAAALKALELIKADSSLLESLRNSKKTIIANCREKSIDIVSGESMIMLVASDDCLDIQRKMLADGYFVVPTDAEIEGQPRSCIRVTANAGHKGKDIEGFSRSLKRNLNK